MHFARPYAAALAATAVALAITLATQRFSATPSYVAFVAAVAVAARFGGKGPAVVASALSLVIIDYFILSPVGVVDFQQPEQGVNVLVFGAVAIIITSMTTRLRRAERESRERAASLARVNAVLEEQMEEVRALDESLHEANEYLTEARDDAARLATGALRLQAATEALSKAATVDDVAHVALAGFAKLAPLSRGAIYLAHGQSLTPVAKTGRRPNNVGGDISATDRGDPRAVAVLSGEPVWVDTVNDATFRGAAAELRYHVSLPLISGDTKVGVLSVDTNTAPPATDAERSLLRLHARAVADALVRAQRYDAERGGREAAETLARAREEVLAVVAHDLRNPLTLVGTSTEMIAELGDDPAKRREMADVVRRSVKRMNTMISDLLDITRLQAGHLALESTALPVSDVLKQVAQGWPAMLAAKGITLTVLPPSPDLKVQADAGRLAQVLDNLLGNAGKFTPPGGRVCVRAERDPGGQVRFMVSDNGPGLAPEALARLFDRFWQARRADRRGIGLGLTICKGIVEAHGGRIWCESASGKGTKFFFTIPSPPSVARAISA
jgi:K+-sensing histidine kinase KdpD